MCLCVYVYDVRGNLHEKPREWTNDFDAFNLITTKVIFRPSYLAEQW